MLFSADRWSNGYKTWWPIYMPHPGHLKLAGVPRHLIHIQEHLQAIQVHIDQFLRLSTSFVSVSARISSLRECESKVLCIVASSRVNQTCISVCRPPWRIGGLPSSQRPSGLVWSGVNDIVWGRRPLLRGQSLLVKIRIKVTVIVFTEET